MSPKTPKQNNSWDFIGISDVQGPEPNPTFQFSQQTKHNLENSLEDAEYHLKEFCRALEDFNDDIPFDLSVSLDLTIENQ